MNEKWNLNDPYLYEALNGLLNQSIAVQTPRGSVRGMLRKVMPDHIVVRMGGAPFYIRMSQIIWVKPEAVRITSELEER
ncbi:YuzF family protein [Amphibacillus indicireducens]|uniref:DUF2642 domain-containing protein n=1 Tax=Amphibacillus indicireducens TaxID=1076330 RepID=A0ABP7V4P9_9BACI